MKKLVLMVMVLAMVLGMAAAGQAALVERGMGMSADGTYKLIYDTDLDITWYDFTKSYNTWDNQMTWAEGLKVTVNGQTYDDWRLPTTPGTNVGYLNEGEMGHLYYDELGNKGIFDANGNYQPDYGLKNKGPFNNLLANVYWSGSEYAPYTSVVWYFDFGNGVQYSDYLGNGSYALAVRPGDVSSVPLPGTVLLLGPALAGMGVLRRKLPRG